MASPPTWLIEDGVFRDHQSAFKAEVQRQGMNCIEVTYQPGKQPPADILGTAALPEEARVIYWGTLPLMQQLKLHRTWQPGGWCHLQNLDCATYYAYFGRYLLNERYTLLPGVEANRLQQHLFDTYGVDDEVFVRPSCLQKIFTGTVAHIENFRTTIAPSHYDPTTLVVVASPKDIDIEWRLVIADDQIVAASQYRQAGAIALSSGCPQRVSEFVAEMLEQVRWRPDPLFMLDVCQCNGRLFLLELNSFSCSGLYACDLSAVIKAASDMAMKA